MVAGVTSSAVFRLTALTNSSESHLALSKGALVSLTLCCALNVSSPRQGDISGVDGVSSLRSAALFTCTGDILGEVTGSSR